MHTVYTHKTTTRSRAGIRALVLSGALVSVGMLGGCDNAGEGLFTGAALGAVTGLVIGSFSGDAGEGAALGAVIGGASGAVLGDQNERNRENARYGNQRRSRAPYCTTHARYHSHHRSSGGGYGYSEWWND